MQQKNQFIVGNFSYFSEADALMAFKEQEKIDKLEEKMDYSQPELVYSVYLKIIKGKMFHTPQGILYLVHLQEYLYSCEYDKVSEIPSIPTELLMVSGKNSGETLKETAKEDSVKIKTENSSEGNPSEDFDVEKAENSQQGSKTQEKRKGKILQEKRTEKNGNGSRRKGGNKKAGAGRQLEEELHISRIIIFFLAAAIIIMLIIASQGNSPTILNYKKQIQNEYVEWQQQLNEKEEELRNRERELEQREQDMKETGEDTGN